MDDDNCDDDVTFGLALPDLVLFGLWLGPWLWLNPRVLESGGGGKPRLVAGSVDSRVRASFDFVWYGDAFRMDYV